MTSASFFLFSLTFYSRTKNRPLQSAIFFSSVTALKVDGRFGTVVVSKTQYEYKNTLGRIRDDVTGVEILK